MIKKTATLIIPVLFLSLVFSPAAGAKGPQELPGSPKPLEIKQNAWITISGQIDTSKAQEVISSLMILDSESDENPVGIRIFSPGGSLSAVMAICDVIENMNRPVVTVALGEAASGAAIILSCGDQRFIGEHTMIMLHQPTIVFEGWRSNFDDLRQFTSALHKVENQMYNLLAENTGKSAALIESTLQTEQWFTAKEAIEFGLADKLLNKAEIRIKKESATSAQQKPQSPASPPSHPDAR